MRNWLDGWVNIRSIKILFLIHRRGTWELLGIHSFHDYFIVLFIHLFYLFIKIKDFMSKLPHGKVPKLDSQGSRYRVKQLVYQMPLQDFSSKHCRKLTLDQKMAMDDMCTKRIEKALGVGKNVVFFTSWYLPPCKIHGFLLSLEISHSSHAIKWILFWYRPSAFLHMLVLCKLATLLTL